MIVLNQVKLPYSYLLRLQSLIRAINMVNTQTCVRLVPQSGNPSDDFIRFSYVRGRTCSATQGFTAGKKAHYVYISEKCKVIRDIVTSIKF